MSTKSNNEAFRTISFKILDMKKRHFLLISGLSLWVCIAGTIDLNVLFNYANQSVPSYINEDNTPSSNPITDEEATLGRVLFYDKNLSLTNSVSCASCHKQALAFGDDAIQSMGHNGGLTGRHSTRLSSARFGEDPRFFWDERASSLEEQTTMPIQDHIEMGFSGTDGDPSFDSLIVKLSKLSYYNELFLFAFGDQTITEQRIQNALAQFVRSIQSFDTKYDIGRAQVGNNNAPFPNFTTQENNGKALYMSNAATGCNRCHRAPEFDIDPDSRNNGVIGVLGSPGSLDLTNERSPSLRDIVNANGVENGPFMHDGSLATLMDVINHYDDIPNNPNNTNLDNRLQGPGGDLDLTDNEKLELLAFLKTLGGNAIYSDPKWSDPFDANGNIEILNGALPIVLDYFHAQAENGQVLLEWQTSFESNVDGFELMHSVDGVEWVEIGFVVGNNEASFYQYVHELPVPGNNYYRLKQIDLDGAFALHDIEFVFIEMEETEIQLYPNPTHGPVHIEFSSRFAVAQVFTMNGKLVFESDLYQSNSFDLSSLIAGVYFVRFLDHANQKTKTMRITKL